MASTSNDNVPQHMNAPENASDELEPGACHDSILNPTDSFEEFASEMSSSLRETCLTTKSSTISEIQSEILETAEDPKLKAAKSSDDLQTKDVSFIDTVANYVSC